MRQAALAWLAECHSWYAYGSARQARTVALAERRPGLVCLWWRGAPHRLQHNVLVEDPRVAGPPAAALEALAPPWTGAGLGTDLRLPPVPGLRAWEGAAAAAGFGPAEVSPLLAFDLATAPAGGPAPGVVVTAADGPADRAAALAVLAAVWGDPALCRFFAPPAASRLYLARLGGEPAAACTTVPWRGVVAIFSVATRAEERGHGVATALLAGVAASERLAGRRLLTLRTSESLVPFYTRRGYALVGHTARWRRPAGGEGGGHRAGPPAPAQVGPVRYSPGPVGRRPPEPPPGSGRPSAPPP